MKTIVLYGILLIAVVLASRCSQTSSGGSSTEKDSSSLLPEPAELGSGFIYLYDEIGARVVES